MDLKGMPWFCRESLGIYKVEAFSKGFLSFFEGLLRGSYPFCKAFLRDKTAFK